MKKLTSTVVLTSALALTATPTRPDILRVDSILVVVNSSTHWTLGHDLFLVAAVVLVLCVWCDSERFAFFLFPHHHAFSEIPPSSGLHSVQ